MRCRVSDQWIRAGSAALAVFLLGAVAIADPAPPTAEVNPVDFASTPAPSTVPATEPAFEEPRDQRYLFWGLVAAGFVIFCGALGANDRLRGDRPSSRPPPRPGSVPPGTTGSVPPGYRPPS
jgi:hypothetical protein